MFTSDGILYEDNSRIRCALSGVLVRRDSLALDVFQNALDAGLATDAALLDAPVGRKVVDGEHAMRVHPHLPGFDAPCHRESLLGVSAPHRSAEAECSLVGAHYGFIEGVVGGDRDCRTELLLGHQRSVVGNVGHHWARSTAIRPLPPSDA